MGNAGQANYSAAKAAVVGLTRTMAKEWGQFKINCNAVAFGYIETRLTASKDDDNVMEIDGEKVQLGIPDQMRGHREDDHPARPARHARGGRGRRLLPLLAVVELRPRAGAAHHGRPDDRDERLTPMAATGAAHAIARVREEDLPDLLPLMAAYLDFYETSAEPAVLEELCRALLADPRGRASSCSRARRTAPPPASPRCTGRGRRRARAAWR
jgi:hypothetical protein